MVQNNCNSADYWLAVMVKLKLSIDKKPMNMHSKLLTEAKVVEQIDKYFYSSHKHGDFGILVWLSDFVWSMVEVVLTAGGRSDSKTHANSNTSSTPQIDEYGRPCEHTRATHGCHCGLPVGGTARTCRYTNISLWVAHRSPTEDFYLSAYLYCRL